MIFKHNDKEHIVIYIEYQDGIPHAAITMYWVDSAKEPYWRYVDWDFEIDPKEIEKFMYYNSGSGGGRTIRLPQYIDSFKGGAYWIAPEAKIKKNITRLQTPIEYEGDPNPFNNGREIYGTDYCKFCEKWYDQDACPEHHIINENGELQYFDGSEVDN